jgi:hypothetical protein
MPRTKRWKPTPEAIRIIRMCAARLTEAKRISIEIAERVSVVTGEQAMDLNAITDEVNCETDLADHWPLRWLRTGKLQGAISARPLVELWIYDASDCELQDQIVVQFDESGDVVEVNGTWRGGKTMYLKGAKR